MLIVSVAMLLKFCRTDIHVPHTQHSPPSLKVTIIQTRVLQGIYVFTTFA